MKVTGGSGGGKGTETPMKWSELLMRTIMRFSMRLLMRLLMGLLMSGDHGKSE